MKEKEKSQLIKKVKKLLSPLIEVDYMIKKINSKRKDSFWFDGHVATVSLGKSVVWVEAMGEIKVSFKPNGDYFRNDEARKEATRLKLNDKDLNKLPDHDAWSNNNWFAFSYSPDGL